ncbi:UNVERIFIED_CONTAM: hypothetical protein IGO34_24490, partial [Salmonella enterica subsp. enterica serovar Weltevreden]
AIHQDGEGVGGRRATPLCDQDAPLSGPCLGAFALQVIHHAKVPVLSIKPEEHPENATWNILAGTSGN